VGGLADAIEEASPQALAEGKGTGFSFAPFTPSAFLAAVDQALRLFEEDPKAFLELRLRGMSQDFSYDRTAQTFLGLYAKAKAKLRR
jgi:starch synthase